ncbi:DUF6438 domain-containing protein [Hymenobacter tibetensis]|uniref:DUF6438 domain-containing protein n=1 Tax=Hymenobacter tibetensis TaxID=497967 RepID=A0ABY4CXR2_9BACT|nr:DUF6438 domain-containing protein [Hymenobacter tibetensis]UOG73784.1 DUF6438 domain-containing protein [Hymenobacter tibetensis]
MRLLLPSLLLSILLASCTSQAPKAPQTTTATTEQSTTAAPVIVFRKTPCFGTCPHYEASIYADGRVAYEGFKYAPVEGKRELKMPISTINSILAEAKAVGFAGLPDTYSAGVSDLPSTVLTLRPATGPAKTVTVEGNAPVELQNLLQHVQKQVEESLGASADR